MTAEELSTNFNDIVRSIGEYHELFYMLVITGRPSFTPAIPTAGVVLNKEGRCLHFLFNPAFLEMLNEEEIRFVLCHEMLHILRNHGRRLVPDGKMANKAQDVVINENLWGEFGFNRENLPLLTEIGIHSLSTSFSEEMQKTLKKRQNFEYYYNRLIEDKENGDSPDDFETGNEGGTLDSHAGHQNISKEELQKVIEEALQNDQKAKDLCEKLEKDNQAGIEPSTETLDIIFRRTQKKRKWESIVGNIRKTIKAKNRGRDRQWVMPDRRMMTINKNFLLPNKHVADNSDGHKWDLYVYQDFSGSCQEYYARFLEACRSIPTDTFNIRFHTFTTEVEEIDIHGDTTPVGGGTSFHIIEEHIQQVIKEQKRKYPPLVFVITDGYGDSVEPEKPENWYWFLTDGLYTNYVPEESRVYSLSDFAE